MVYYLGKNDLHLKFSVNFFAQGDSTTGFVISSAVEKDKAGLEVELLHFDTPLDKTNEYYH